MTTVGNSPTSLDFNITKSTDTSFAFTCTDSNSDPLDITGYEFYFVARDSEDVGSTKRIEVLDADIVQSDSGTGTTDTFTISITNLLSNIIKGAYYYEIRSKVTSSGSNDVWFNGVLYINWTVQGAR